MGTIKFSNYEKRGLKQKVPNDSSKDAALEKLTQVQLIEIVDTLKKQQQKLIEERDVLRRQLQELSSQNIASNIVGNTPSVSSIVEQTQQTAEKCLESVRDMNAKAQLANNEIIEAASRQASSILKDAELQAQHILNSANIKAQALSVDARRYPTTFDLLDADIDDPMMLDETYSVPRAADLLENVENDVAYRRHPQLPYEAQFIEELTKLGLEYDDLLENAASFQDEYEEDDDFHIKPEDILAPTVKIMIGEEKTWEEESQTNAKEAISLSDDLISGYDPLEESEEYIKAYQEILESQMNALEDSLAAANEDEAAASTSGERPIFPVSQTAAMDTVDAQTSTTPSNSTVDLEDSDGSELSVVGDLAKGKSSLDNASEEESTHEDQLSETEIPYASTVENETLFSMGKTEAFEPLDPSISGLLSMTKAERKAAKKAAKAARKAAKRSGNPRLEKMKAENPDKTLKSEESVTYPHSELLESEEGDFEKFQNSAEAYSGDPAQTQDQLMNKAREMLRAKTVPEIMQASYESFTNVNRVQESSYSDFDYDMCFDDADAFKETIEAGPEQN